MSAIEGKITLITGSAQGIGKATAKEFARQGARLFLCDLNPETLAAAKAELEAMGAEVAALRYDARDPQDVETVFNAVIETYGDIDILVNNTGIPGPTASILETTLEDWNAVMEINLRGTFLFSKLAAPYMIKKQFGKIINLSSMTGKRSLLHRTPYCTSKTGVIGFTRCLAEELGVSNINVNAVCPGVVAGDRLDMLFTRAMERTGQSRETIMAGLMASSMIKRPTPPEKIAKLIVFLADDDLSNDITAQDFNINCGIYSD
jgi:NAD(P)-dependent dehydrogenase (short-subunit alcohol dehydrogenase family)